VTTYGVRPPDNSIRRVCEQFRAQWQCGKQSFPERDKRSNKDVGRVRLAFLTESQEVHLPSKCRDRDGT